MKPLTAALAASAGAGALGYVCGRSRPVRNAQDVAGWRLRMDAYAPKGWPEPARRAAAWFWVVVHAFGDPREFATRLWLQRHPDPDRAPVNMRLLTPEERAQKAADAAREAARPPYLRHSAVHGPWWEPRHGLQLVAAGKSSSMARFWTAWGARRFGRKALAVAERRR